MSDRSPESQQEDYERRKRVRFLAGKRKGPHRNYYKSTQPEFVPIYVLDERDMRLALWPYSLTASIMGDPLPGMSALDRKRA